MRHGLELRGLSKTFAGQRALADVSLAFPAGSVTALLGHNGSGKSTLVKILAGFYEPDEGGIVVVGGTSVPLPISPREAHRVGLRFMHQDLALVDALTIADNFAFVDGFHTAGMLGPISRRREHERVARVLAALGIDEDPGRTVSELDPTTKTMIAMARAVQDSRDVAHAEQHVLFLDEPTAALPAVQVERVLDLIRNIRARGGAIVLVTHRIDEVLRIADHVVVLREGRVVAELDREGLDEDTLVNLIVGTAAGTPSVRREQASSEVVFSTRGLTAQRLRAVDLDVHRGEIVGIAGLLGCGRSELARILAGAQRATEGASTLCGTAYAPASPADALCRGVTYVPQDRRGTGCITGMSLQENLSLGTLGTFFTRGWLRLGRERKATNSAIDAFRILPPDPRRLVAYFSGGNQQKAVVARAVGRQPKLLVLDEPMQGIDVGAKAEIARIVRRLADDGVAVIVGATDAVDLVGLCDRVLVLNRGHFAGVLTGEDITEEQITMRSVNADRDEALR